MQRNDPVTRSPFDGVQIKRSGLPRPQCNRVLFEFKCRPDRKRFSLLWTLPQSRFSDRLRGERLVVAPSRAQAFRGAAQTPHVAAQQRSSRRKCPQCGRARSLWPDCEKSRKRNFSKMLQHPVIVSLLSGLREPRGCARDEASDLPFMRLQPVMLTGHPGGALLAVN